MTATSFVERFPSQFYGEMNQDRTPQDTAQLNRNAYACTYVMLKQLCRVAFVVGDVVVVDNVRYVVAFKTERNNVLDVYPIQNLIGLVNWKHNYSH